MLKEIAILTDIICKTALNSITLSDEVLKQKLKELYNDKSNETLKRFLEEKETMPSLYIALAEWYYRNNDYDNTILLCDSWFKKIIIDRKKENICLLSFLRYSSYLRKGNFLMARKDASYVINNALSNQTLLLGDIILKERAISDFNKIESLLINNFIEQAYDNRKIILAVKNYDLPLELTDNILVVSTDCLHKMKLNFPMGNPIPMKLYVGHPFINNTYIPFENYELILLEEKLREYCKIAQCLGAIDIEVISLNSVNNGKSINTISDVFGEIGYKFAEFKVDKSQQNKRSTTEGANTSILFHQKFSPKGRIFLPDNLIWYNNNHSVIRLYEQRLHGNLLEHQEKIEITTNKIIESQELETIQAEFKNVISSVKGSYSESVSEELNINKSETLSIRIKFCNLNNGEVVGNFKNKLISNFGQKIIKYIKHNK